jgi:GH15 family glucan-1,4-alpha-glucosidase
MYRYSPGADDLDGGEGAFLPCSFWLVEALIKVGRRDEGIQVFEDILRMVGDLCLLPEEIDPSTHAFLGNYPIALSQAGVVHAIVEIENALRA